MRAKPLFWLAFSAALALPATGRAAPTPCSALDNPVYVAGAPAAEPLVKQVAQLLQRSEAQRLTVIWQLKTSCDAVDALARDTGGACTNKTCMTGQARFWTLDPRDTEPKECDLPTTGARIDVALSDVFPQTCPSWSQTPLPSTVMDYSASSGPISPYALAMDKQAAENSIYAVEGHFVFGAGKSAGVQPWLNDAVIAALGDQDSGQLLVGQQLKLALGRWKGTAANNPDEVVTMLFSDPAQGIGVMPTSIIDARRAEVKALAFQALKGRVAFYPDRKPSSFEKQNVRDGHYPIWGYLHALMQKDSAMPTQPRSQTGRRLADILLGASSAVGGKDTLLLQTQAGLVPRCAMKVSRKDDRSPMMPWLNPEPCHCWFEKNVSGGLLGCKECPDGKDATCGGSGKCRRSLCEVQ